jgi:hypothetical protein
MGSFPRISLLSPLVLFVVSAVFTVVAEAIHGGGSNMLQKLWWYSSNRNTSGSKVTETDQL